MNSNNPSISVVLPVYNMELYLNEAIDSILIQTFTDFEFIIIDDGSTDNTWNIIQSYEDKRIVPIQNDVNSGNYPSRNKGMKMARGRYIAVMDGDDIAMPERLEKQYLYFESNPNLIALGSEFEIDTKEKKEIIPLKHREICFSLLRSFGLLHSSLMIKTDVLKSLNGYSEKYEYASDYDLFCMLSLIGEIENLPDKLMRYRKHEKQISQAKKVEQDECAKNIRRQYQVSFINKYKSKYQSLVTFSEVGIPEIGLAICYYTYAANNSSFDKYRDLANKTIDVIYKITTKNIPLCIENGLCGLGCGFHYMIKNRFLDGDVDEILEDIDDKVITALHKGFDQEYIKDMLFYINYRISKSNNINSKKIQYLSSLYADFVEKYTKTIHDKDMNIS